MSVELLILFFQFWFSSVDVITKKDDDEISSEILNGFKDSTLNKDYTERLQHALKDEIRQRLAYVSGYSNEKPWEKKWLIWSTLLYMKWIQIKIMLKNKIHVYCPNI